MKAITIRGIDSSISEKLKYAAQREGKSVNKFILELISQNLGTQKKKKFSKQYNDLDHLFGKWSKSEHEKIQGDIDKQRKIDPELWQ
ncbi:MAG: antitoxin [Proteobacteria bacterium]|nr:antitoxin [Pseudomonadota bacterium]